MTSGSDGRDMRKRGVSETYLDAVIRRPILFLIAGILVFVALSLFAPRVPLLWRYLGESTQRLDRDGLEKLNFIGIILQGSLGVAAALAVAIVAIAIAAAAHRVSEAQANLQEQMAAQIRNTLDREQLDRIHEELRSAYGCFVQVGNALEELVGLAWNLVLRERHERIEKRLQSTQVRLRAIDSRVASYIADDYIPGVRAAAVNLVAAVEQLRRDPLSLEIWRRLGTDRPQEDLLAPMLVGRFGASACNVVSEPAKYARLFLLTPPLTYADPQARDQSPLAAQLLEQVQRSSESADLTLEAVRLVAETLGGPYPKAVIHDLVALYPTVGKFGAAAWLILHERYKLAGDHRLLQMIDVDARLMDPHTCLADDLRAAVSQDVQMLRIAFTDAN